MPSRRPTLCPRIVRDGLTAPVASLALLLVLFTGPVTGQEYDQARGVIHLDTTVSGGDYTPEEMADFLAKNEIEVGIYTDHDTVRWDYGFFPSRWLTGKLTGWLIASAFGRSSSVQTYGAEAYVRRIADVDEQTDSVILLPGVEAIPFFYWEGSLLFNTLSIHNAYKHLLAFGLRDPEDYARLPSVGEGFFRSFGLDSLLSLWPAALIILVLQIFGATRSSPFHNVIRPVGIVLIVIAALFLTQNFPYAYPRYDQYHGDQGARPYQDFIDYVVDNGGLVFWAHPEIEVDRVVEKPPLKVRLETPAYHTDLLFTRDYTGFSAFFEGMKHILPPGGIWDQVLDEYATGRRERPVWAIAEGDVEGDHFSPKLSETVFLLKARTRTDVLDALREGRVYAVAGPNAHHFSLETFELSTDLNRARAGETVEANPASVTVTARLHFDAPTESRTRIHATLIRNGEPVGTYQGDGRIELTYRIEDDLATGRLHYFRIDASAPNQTRLVSNPIFLSPAP